jgi:hypothetical protein
MHMEAPPNEDKPANDNDMSEEQPEKLRTKVDEFFAKRFKLIRGGIVPMGGAYDEYLTWSGNDQDSLTSDEFEEEMYRLSCIRKDFELRARRTDKHWHKYFSGVELAPLDSEKLRD